MLDHALTRLSISGKNCTSITEGVPDATLGFHANLFLTAKSTLFTRAQASSSLLPEIQHLTYFRRFNQLKARETTVIEQMAF
jgi:hypothetical protein